MGIKARAKAHNSFPIPDWTCIQARQRECALKLVVRIPVRNCDTIHIMIKLIFRIHSRLCICFDIMITSVHSNNDPCIFIYICTFIRGLFAHLARLWLNFLFSSFVPNP